MLPRDTYCIYVYIDVRVNLVFLGKNCLLSIGGHKIKMFLKQNVSSCGHINLNAKTKITFMMLKHFIGKPKQKQCEK